MARVSFLDRVQPNRMRSKLITWPFAVEGEPPRVRVKVLGANELEAANLATVDYFKNQKKAVKSTDGAFVAREHVELVWRAFSDEDGQRLAETAADMAKEPSEIIMPLYNEWTAFQSEVSSRPLKQSELDELIEALKKNTLGDLLDVLPSIWLRQLLLTLAAQHVSSITESSPG